MKKAKQQDKAITFFTGLTKPGIIQLATNAVQQVLENGNVLQAAESLSAMENFIDAVRKNPQFLDYAREEIAKHGKGGFTSASGAKLENAETGTKYIYDNTGDDQITALYESKKEIEKKIKAREEFLKALPDIGLNIMNEETGELLTIYRPAKTSKSSYKVTLAN